MDDQSSNNSLKLERLRNEYNLTIIEYNNAYQDFMNLVNRSGSNISNINSVYLVLSEINSRLNNIVNAINDLLNKIEPATSEELEHKREVINSLNVEYESLNNKNNKIKNLTKQNDNLTNEYNITSIMINKSVFTYFLWILILLILLFFIIKYVFYS